MKNLFGKVKANRFIQEGLEKVARGDFEAAIEKFSRAIEADPEDMDAYSLRGSAYIDINDNVRAVADLDYAILKRPDHHADYYNRSIARMGLDEKDLALADMDQAIELAPEEAGYYLHRSIVRSLREEHDLALQDVNSAIELGADRMGYNNRAIIYEKMGDHSSAISDWTRIVEIDPKNAIAYCRRGILLAAGGKRDAAIDDLKRGLKNRKQLPEPLRERTEKTLQGLGESLK